jgi:surfeit locus 1 family protein
MRSSIPAIGTGPASCEHDGALPCVSSVNATVRRVIAFTAGMAMLALLLRLGFWQLERARYKDALQTRFDAGRTADPASPESLLALPGGESSWRFHPALFTGAPDAQRQYLLDNRTHRGRAGYHVLSVVRGSRVALLVNRGWLPVGLDRAALPDLPLDTPTRTFRGLLAPPPRGGLLLGESGYDGAGWPRVVQQVDIARIAAQTGSPLLPVMLLLDSDDPACQRCEWTAVAGPGADRHRGYAVQWFSLAAALIVIVAVLALRRVRHRDGA